MPVYSAGCYAEGVQTRVIIVILVAWGLYVHRLRARRRRRGGLLGIAVVWGLAIVVQVIRDNLAA